MLERILKNKPNGKGYIAEAMAAAIRNRSPEFIVHINPTSWEESIKNDCLKIVGEEISKGKESLYERLTKHVNEYWS